MKSTPPRPLRQFALQTLFWLGLGLFFSTRVSLSHALGRMSATWSSSLFIWSSHWLLWGAAVPLIAALGRRFPLLPLRPRTLAVHLLLAPLVATVQFGLNSIVVLLTNDKIPGMDRILGVLGPEFANLFHFGLLTYFLILGYLTATAHVRRSREEELRSSRLAEQLAQAELAALRMQLHPHFLFNSLHSAAELVHENPAAAERSLLGLADLLRRALRASERGEVSLAEELEFVDGYLALEAIRLEGKLTVDYRVDEALLERRVPSLLLQPLVENAIRHGIARRPQGGAITIAASTAGGRLALEVENDAPAPHAVAARGGNGIGLANVRARLENLYGDDARLEVGRSGPAQFRARIELPLPAAGAPGIAANLHTAVGESS